MNVVFKNGYLEITKRELIASISIIALLLIIGIAISDKIMEYHADENEIYNKAAKIETAEMFEYGMNTDIGNAFVYGKLQAVDAVTYPEIGGSYMYIEKEEESYNAHTRVISNGKTTYTKVYYTWDHVNSENKKCKEVTFCDVKFKSNKFNLPAKHYIKTIYKSGNVRYQYYGVSASRSGTIFTDLRDGTISNNSDFYEDKDIDETLKDITVTYNVILIMFWICWIFLTATVVYFFYMAENKWLE